MNVPNHGKVPFRDMTPEERSAIVEAVLIGEADVFCVDFWSGVPCATHIAMDEAYRTRPRQLIIPWEHIRPEYKWAAMDSDGEVILHAEKPMQSDLGFFSNCERVADVLNIDTTGIDWRESLVKRHEGA